MLYFVDHLSSFCCVVIDIQSRVSFASRAQVILSYLTFPIETRHDMISKKKKEAMVSLLLTAVLIPIEARVVYTFSILHNISSSLSKFFRFISHPFLKIAS